MCLQAQGIDNNNDRVGRVRCAHRLSDGDRDFGRRRGIDDMSEVLETITDAARISGR